MYNLAQLPWDRTISFGMYLSLADYNIGITAVSLDPNQFSVSHVVIALQDTVTALSRLRAFFEVTCKVSLKGRLIGRLEIGHHEPVAGAGGGSGSGSGSNVAILNDSDVAGGDASLSTAGQIIDPDDEKLAITYQLYGRIITIQEIFTAVLDALAISAQFEESAECHLIEAVSVMGSCAISVAHSIGQPLEMRYSQATRTLLLLVNEVMVRQRRFGEMWFQVSYDGGVVGEGYVLKVNQVGNATGETASAR